MTFLSRLACFLRSRTGIASIVLLLGAVTTHFVWQRREPEPSYRNMPASAWLELATTNWNNASEATDAFTEMGPAGVEFLGQELIRKPSKWDEWLLAHHQSIPESAKKVLLKPRRQVKEDTILRLLFIQKANAAPAIPMLLTWLESTNSSSHNQIIAPVGSISISSNQFSGLSVIHGSVPSPHRILIRNASNQVHSLSISAGISLLIKTQAVVTAPGTVITNVFVTTISASNTIPTVAYDILYKVGTEDPRVIPQLFRPIENRATYWPFSEFGTNLSVAASQSIPFLVKKAGSASRYDRLIAVSLLKLTMPQSSAGKETLIQMLKDNDPQVFDLAIGALQSCTNDVERILPLALDGIRRRLNSPSTPYQRRTDPALITLKEFAPYSPGVTSGLQELLKENPKMPYPAMIRLLGEIGTTNSVDVSFISSFTNNLVTIVRAEAWNALGNLTGDTNAFVMEQVTLIDSGHLWASYIALGKMGPAAWPAVPKLREGLKNNEIRIIAKAAETLGKIGPRAWEALPDLIALRNHPHFMIREPVEEAIHLIIDEPKAKGAE